MLNATHPMVPDRHRPGRSLPAQAPVVWHQTQARVNPRRFRVGHAVQLDGYTFVWDGSQFRSARREDVTRAAYRRQGRLLLLAILLGSIMAWAAVYGLDWAAMTWDQRAPYMWAGGMACVILLVSLWWGIRASPRWHARETDRWLKTHLGIKHR